MMAAYLVALGLVASMALAGHGILRRGLARQQRSAEVINLAGRQRMLSQRIALQATLLRLEPGEERRRRLRDNLRLWSKNHRELTRGELAQLVAELRPVVRARLDAAYQSLYDSAAAVVGGRKDASVEDPIQVLEDAEGYLPLMDEAVFAYSERVTEGQDDLVRWELMLTSATMLVLVFEALFVSWPLSRRIGDVMLALRRTLKRFEQSEARYSRAVEGSDDGLFDYERDTGALYLSPRFRELLELPSHEQLRWSDVQERALPSHGVKLLEALENKESGRLDLEFRVKRTDGMRWFRLRGRMLDEGQFCAGVITDIELRKRRDAEHQRLLLARDLSLADTREDLVRSEMTNAIGSLAAGVAHDFNNYLQVIHLNAESLDVDGDQAEILDGILTASEDASRLASQLLLLKEGPNDALQEPLVEVKLDTLLEKLSPMISSLLPSIIHLNIDIPGLDGLSVRASETHLRQALINLCLNAKDAMPEGGSLLLRAESSHRVFGADRRWGVQIAVEDTGIGMSPELQARVFEPFFSTKQRSRGSGLGLSMVASIVRRFAGTVDISSAEGAGTSVAIWLPLSTGRPADEQLPAAEMAPLDVFVVDDDPDILAGVRRILGNYGHTVRCAHSASETLNMDFSRPPDVLVADVMLGDAYGPDVADELARALGRPLPTVLMTGMSDVELDLSVPSVALLRKPFSAAELIRALGEVMAGARMQT